jgi:CrcB protein
MIWIYVAAGGVAGTLARFWLQGAVQRFAPGGFPLGTFTVNVLGSLVLGFLMKLALGSQAVGPEGRAALGIGFCGAFTTFSTLVYETVTLIEDGRWGTTLAYAGGSFLAGLLAIWLGFALARAIL